METSGTPSVSLSPRGATSFPLRARSTPYCDSVFVSEVSAPKRVLASSNRCAARSARPFLHGLALLAAHRFEEARTRFGADTSDTNTESQYGVDLARKGNDVAPLGDKDTDGVPLVSIPDEGLQARIREAARAFRSAREKNSYRPGDTLPAEVALHQKRFVALLVEYFARTRAIQEFCLREGIADLVRR